MRSVWLHGALVLIALALVVGATPSTGWSEIDGDTFTSEEWRISISAPANWQMSEQRSYAGVCMKATVDPERGSQECTRSRDKSSQASILLWLHRRSPPGKMLLAAELLSQQTTSAVYAEKTFTLLGKLGFQVRPPQLHAATGAYVIEFDNGTAFLRQAVLVHGDIGYSLTLSAPDARSRAQHIRAFDYALRLIRIDRGDASPDSGSDTVPPPVDPEDPEDDAPGDTSADGTDGSKESAKAAPARDTARDTAKDTSKAAPARDTSKAAPARDTARDTSRTAPAGKRRGQGKASAR